MNRNEFVVECLARQIDPEIALENDDLVDAMRQRDDEVVIRILSEEF